MLVNLPDHVAYLLYPPIARTRRLNTDLTSRQSAQTKRAMDHSSTRHLATRCVRHYLDVNNFFRHATVCSLNPSLLCHLSNCQLIELIGFE